MSTARLAEETAVQEDGPGRDPVGGGHFCCAQPAQGKSMSLARSICSFLSLSRSVLTLRVYRPSSPARQRSPMSMVEQLARAVQRLGEDVLEENTARLHDHWTPTTDLTSPDESSRESPHSPSIDDDDERDERRLTNDRIYRCSYTTWSLPHQLHRILLLLSYTRHRR
jgi:hypothetical protein